MTTNRKFCRFNKEASTAAFSMAEIPESGLCLSTFLVINEKGKPRNILMGKLNTEADWEHIGALDPERISVHSKGWMIPSSHLIFRESPQEAAKRIAKEQLEIKDIDLSGPQVISYVYPPKRFPEFGGHWDIEFVFTGELNKENIPKSLAWTDLRFVNLDVTSKKEISRSHEDILESLGFHFNDA